jgi:hypothetical protein
MRLICPAPTPSTWSGEANTMVFDFHVTADTPGEVERAILVVSGFALGDDFTGVNVNFSCIPVLD